MTDLVAAHDDNNRGKLDLFGGANWIYWGGKDALQLEDIVIDLVAAHAELVLACAEAIAN
eukprot:COSAG06_NODE_3554_length_5196_cov_4.040024_2_plen_60_part_00